MGTRELKFYEKEGLDLRETDYGGTIPYNFL